MWKGVFKLQAGAVLLAMAVCITPVSEASSIDVVQAYSAGEYAVGITNSSVKDFNRPFDHWGNLYKSADYPGLPKRTNDSGEPAMAIAKIYYSSLSSGTRVAREASVYPSALWVAKSGIRHNRVAMAMADKALANSGGQ